MATPKADRAFCSECKIWYPSYMAYAAHRKRKMADGQGHVHCGICGMDFVLRETLARHLQQEHAHEQDLTCPGCNLHYTRVGSLISHIETNKCLGINKSDIEQARWTRSQLKAGLATLEGADKSKSYFGWCVPSGQCDTLETALSSVGISKGLLGRAGSSIVHGRTLSTTDAKKSDARSLGPITVPKTVTAQHAVVSKLQHDFSDATKFPTPAEAGAQTAQTRPNQHHPAARQIEAWLSETQEDPTEQSQDSETSSIYSGVSKSAAESPKKAVPPHLRGKMSQAGTTDCSPSSKASTTNEVGATECYQSSRASTINQPARSVPPHLRGKIRQAETTESSQISKASTANTPILNQSIPPHLQSQLGAGLVAAGAKALTRVAGLDTVTPKQTMGSLMGDTEDTFVPTSDAMAKGVSHVPPHLRGKRGVGPGPQITSSKAVVEDRAQAEATTIAWGLQTPSTRKTPSESKAVVVQNRVQAEETTSANIKTHGQMEVDYPPLGEAAVKPVWKNVEIETRNPEQLEQTGFGLGQHDPEHPDFDARDYYEKFTRRYQCPIKNCGKLFKSMQGVTGHLGSDVHRGPPTKLQCPHCLRYFKSVAALTQHAESQGRRCEIRSTMEFRPFLDQLTGGIADLEGFHEDDTNRYVITDEAVYKYGDEEPRGRAIKALDDQRSREIGEKGGEFWQGKTIAW